MKIESNPFNIHFPSKVIEELKKKDKIRKNGIILRRKQVHNIDTKKDKKIKDF